MTKAEAKTVELIYDILKEFKQEFIQHKDKISTQIAKVHEKVDSHIAGPCSVQRELTDFKDTHKEEEGEVEEQQVHKRTFLRMDLQNVITFAGVIAAILIAVFK